VRYICSWSSPTSLLLHLLFVAISDNLWKSKLVALEKPGKPMEFFSCFVAILLE